MAGEIVPSRPFTSSDRDAIVKPVRDGLRDLILGSPGLFDDRPGFIAAPPSGNPLTDTVRAISQFNCRRWAAADKSGFSSRVNTGNANLCSPYLQGLGEDPDDGGFPLPFEGGQCDAKYVLSYQGTTREGVGSYNARVLTWGPVGGARSVDRGDGRFDVEFLSSGALIATLDCNQNPSKGEYTWRKVNNIGILGPDDGGTFSILTACGSDNCGDPPRQIRPPATVTPTTPIPPNITVDVPGFGPVTVTVDPDVDGDPVVCFEEVEVCVTVKPDVEGGGGAGGGAPLPNPEVGPPIDGPPAGGDGGGSDNDFGDPPEGRVWIGAIVKVLGDMVPSGVVPGSAPGNGALTKVVGNASLYFDDPVEGLLRFAAGQLRSEWSEHFVPLTGLTVKGIRVNINPALSYRVYPVSVEDPNLEQSE